MTNLVEKFYKCMEGDYGPEEYHTVLGALAQLDRIRDIVQRDSLASDGMLMIESALRDDNDNE